MALQMIQNTETSLCDTIHFLDTLSWVEKMVPPSKRELPSPVFIIPSDPYEIYQSFIITLQMCDYVKENRKEKFYTSKMKNKNKNHNQHLRKMGRLKQPGGASCNQRR
jgi:hypothetical protein